MKNIQKIVCAFFLGLMFVGDLSAMRGQRRNLEASSNSDTSDDSDDESVYNPNAIVRMTSFELEDKLRAARWEVYDELTRNQQARHIQHPNSRQAFFNKIKEISDALPGAGLIAKTGAVLGAGAWGLYYLGYFGSHFAKIFGGGSITREMAGWLAAIGAGIDLVEVFSALKIIYLSLTSGNNWQEKMARFGHGVKWVAIALFLMLVHNKYC